MEQLFEGCLAAKPVDKCKKHEYYEAVLLRVNKKDELIFQLGNKMGVMPLSEFSALPPNRSAAVKLCGKKLGFYVTGETNENYTLSRKQVQQEYLDTVVSKYKVGDIVNGKVSNIASNLCFVELGYGYTALLMLENVCVAHINSLNQVFSEGQEIKVMVSEPLSSSNKLGVSMKELLGTWEENLDYVDAEKNEEILTGFVSRVADYGAYIILTPNLYGLCDENIIEQKNLHAGDTVCCVIKRARKDNGKLIIKVCNNLGVLPDVSCYFQLHYFIEGKTFGDSWRYSPSKTFTHKKTIADMQEAEG